jgi:hypothetical protein
MLLMLYSSPAWEVRAAFACGCPRLMLQGRDRRLQPGLAVERSCFAHRTRTRYGHADRAAALERQDTLATRRGGAAMADLPAHAALLRTQDMRRDILVAGANHDTLMADP